MLAVRKRWPSGAVGMAAPCCRVPSQTRWSHAWNGSASAWLQRGSPVRSPAAPTHCPHCRCSSCAPCSANPALQSKRSGYLVATPAPVLLGSPLSVVQQLLGEQGLPRLAVPAVEEAARAAGEEGVLLALALCAAPDEPPTGMPAPTAAGQQPQQEQGPSCSSQPGSREPTPDCCELAEGPWQARGDGRLPGAAGRFAPLQPLQRPPLQQSARGGLAPGPDGLQGGQPSTTGGGAAATSAAAAGRTAAPRRGRSRSRSASTSHGRGKRRRRSRSSRRTRSGSSRRVRSRSRGTRGSGSGERGAPWSIRRSRGRGRSRSRGRGRSRSRPAPVDLADDFWVGGPLGPSLHTCCSRLRLRVRDLAHVQNAYRQVSVFSRTPLALWVRSNARAVACPPPCLPLPRCWSQDPTWRLELACVRALAQLGSTPPSALFRLVVVQGGVALPPCLFAGRHEDEVCTTRGDGQAVLAWSSVLAWRSSSPRHRRPSMQEPACEREAVALRLACRQPALGTHTRLFAGAPGRRRCCRRARSRASWASGCTCLNLSWHAAPRCGSACSQVGTRAVQQRARCWPRGDKPAAAAATAAARCRQERMQVGWPLCSQREQPLCARTCAGAEAFLRYKRAVLACLWDAPSKRCRSRSVPCRQVRGSA